MRMILLVAVLALASPVLGSEPGQPLDCSDWVFLQPGLTCGYYAPAELCTSNQSDPRCSVGANPRQCDAAGAVLATRRRTLFTLPCFPWTAITRFEIIRLVADRTEVLAYMDDRCAPSQYRDFTTGEDSAILFDAISGRLLVSMHSHSTSPPGVPGLYPHQPWIAELRGFSTLIDLFESYSPDQRLSFVVPTHPEALRAAERFDTYWGALSTPLDLASAQPLQCSYPDHTPSAGEYLQITAPVPTPSPGHANYVLTSVTYQGQTRAGRRAESGKLSGRDASALPTCIVAPERTAR